VQTVKMGMLIRLPIIEVCSLALLRNVDEFVTCWIRFHYERLRTEGTIWSHTVRFIILLLPWSR
jgi:hypothetical protein